MSEAYGGGGGRREAFGGAEAFPGEKLVAIEELEETSHTAHLFSNLVVLLKFRC